ncbi:MAG TPA: NAD-dependent epimerase/dehydratase family protein [Gemmatimonadaceae bacterium]|nr:NAD-dependent epimerase/dehydratase family protein [Gemmatimonadaceae bacterium]
MPTALITGASGLVGSHACERLLAEGWRVRALVRDEAGAAWLRERGVDLHPGDILDQASFEAAARGCDLIVHCAAAVVARGGWEEYRRPNLDGTRNAIAAAARSGARLVQVSSVSVYGAEARYAASRRPCDEETPLEPLPEHAHYARSKRDSEAMVLAAHADGRIWATAVRPDVIYGVRDREFVPRLARVMRARVFPLLARGRETMAIVHAANVADGIVRAATADVAGGRTYNLANDYDVTVAEFVRLAAVGLGHRVIGVPVPVTLARAAMAVARPVTARIMGASAAVMARSTVDFLTRGNPFSSERARRELGWDPPMRPEIGIPEAFRWAKAARGR